ALSTRPRCCASATVTSVSPTGIRDCRRSLRKRSSSPPQGFWGVVWRGTAPSKPPYPPPVPYREEERMQDSTTTSLPTMPSAPHLSATGQASARAGDAPHLSAAERELLESWNRTTAPYPDGACIHQLFEAAALRASDALAVVS